MSEHDPNVASIEEQAALWLVRSRAPDLSDADIVALTQWLEASPDHVDAFDRAEDAWFAQPETPAAASDAPLVASPVVLPFTPRAVRPAARRAVPAWGMAAMAASLVFGLVAIGLVAQAPKGAVYQTAAGEVHDLVLPDGSRMHLAPQSRARVIMTRKFRRIELASGSLTVKVRHDAAVPFVVRSGDQTTTDVGTAFTVTRSAGDVVVAVTEGVVAVSLDKGQGAPILVRAGFESRHGEGTPVIRVRALNVASRPTQVTYLDRPLSDVVRDLNTWFDTPVEADTEAGRLRVNAVIRLDSEESVVKRLQAFLPVQAVTTDQKIILRSRRH